MFLGLKVKSGILPLKYPSDAFFNKKKIPKKKNIILNKFPGIIAEEISFLSIPVLN